MNILFLSWNYPPVVGGIEYLVLHLHEGLVARGHNVTVLTACHPKADLQADEIRNVFRPRGRGLMAYLCFAVRRGAQEVRRRRPDIILVGSPVAAPAAFVLSRLYRIPFAMLAHGSDVVLPNRLYQFVMRRLLRAARRVIPNSQHTRSLLRDRGMPDERIVVIHPGVDVAAATKPPPDERLAHWQRETQGRRVLLTVGRLIRRKGIPEMIRHVMPQLVQRHPDLLFLIVGDDAVSSLVHHEKMSDVIRAAIGETNMSAHVRMLGRLSDDDLQAAFRCSEMFVMPCLDLPNDIEGFGIVLLEAGLAGVPSIATRVGGIPDALQENVTGLLVAPGDHESFAAAVLRLLDDQGLRRRMGEAAARRAREQFAWDVITAQHERVLADAIASDS